MSDTPEDVVKAAKALAETAASNCVSSAALGRNPIPGLTKAIAKAILAERERWSPKERDPAVAEILAPYRGYVTSERPELLSLLYDIDMLPEQTVTARGAIRLAGLLEVWKRMEAAEADSVVLRIKPD